MKKSRAGKLLDQFREAKKVPTRGVRLDSVGVFLALQTSQKKRSGPKQLDIKLDMSGFSDPDGRVGWRNKKFDVEDPLDLSADEPVKAEVRDALLKAAKQFDNTFVAEMKKLGFKKEI